jgi:hypothetical protein
MLALAAVALVSVLRPSPRLAGLPDDPDLSAARALLGPRMRADAGELRFRATLLGGEALGHTVTAADAEPLYRAEALMRRAAERHPRDPRLRAAFACLDLLRRDLGPAERRYRWVLDRGRPCAEARLGLGVALAMRAEAEPDGREQRALQLEAIGQLAQVEKDDAEYGIALYDRALLLARVGRRDEARLRAAEYFALDPAGPWSARLGHAVAAAASSRDPR